MKKFRILSKTVHRAGTNESLLVAQYIYEKFKKFGLDRVESEEYKVLLSYPNASAPDEVKNLSRCYTVPLYVKCPHAGFYSGWTWKKDYRSF